MTLVLSCLIVFIVSLICGAVVGALVLWSMLHIEDGLHDLEHEIQNLRRENAGANMRVTQMEFGFMRHLDRRSIG